SNVHPFINNSFEEGGKLISASLSPDGRVLAFVSRKDRTDHPTDAVFLLDITSMSITSLINDDKYDNDFPVWSPDGNKLAYLERGLFGNYAYLAIWDRQTQETQLVHIEDI